MVHLLGWVLQLNGADIRNISKSLQISDKFFGWQDISYQGVMYHDRAANQTKGESAVTLNKGNYIN
jgi:hypothetical protein